MALLIACMVRQRESDPQPLPVPQQQGPVESLSQRPLADHSLMPPPTSATASQPSDLRVNRRAFFSVTAGLGAMAVTELRACDSRTADHAVTYAFADEFDGPAGSAPDPSKWGYDIGGGGWGNDDLAVYTSSRANSFLNGDGNLVIRATKNVRTSDDRTASITYHSARLKTIGKFSKYRGSFEARIKLDIQPGLWPAWWALGANFPKVGWPVCGEVDMLENYGGSMVESSVHTPNYAGTSILTKCADIPVDDGWHVWRMLWSSETGGFTFYRDDTKYMTIAPAQMANWCFSSGVPMFMIINLAVGGAAGIPPDRVRFPVDLLVDYVRVW
jgi:beta-glucanase (GH16 family)